MFVPLTEAAHRHTLAATQRTARDELLRCRAAYMRAALVTCRHKGFHGARRGACPRGNGGNGSMYLPPPMDYGRRQYDASARPARPSLRQRHARHHTHSLAVIQTHTHSPESLYDSRTSSPVPLSDDTTSDSDSSRCWGSDGDASPHGDGCAHDNSAACGDECAASDQDSDAGDCEPAAGRPVRRYPSPNRNSDSSDGAHTAAVPRSAEGDDSSPLPRVADADTLVADADGLGTDADSSGDASPPPSPGGSDDGDGGSKRAAQRTALGRDVADYSNVTDAAHDSADADVAMVATIAVCSREAPAVRSPAKGSAATTRGAARKVTARRARKQPAVVGAVPVDAAKGVDGAGPVVDASAPPAPSALVRRAVVSDVVAVQAGPVVAETDGELASAAWRGIAQYAAVRHMVMVGLKARFGGDASDADAWIAHCEGYHWLDEMYCNVKDVYQLVHNEESAAFATLISDVRVVPSGHAMICVFARLLRRRLLCSDPHRVTAVPQRPRHRSQRRVVGSPLGMVLRPLCTSTTL